MPLTTWIVQNTLAAGCLALVVAAVCRWGRLSPALRHGLWLVVLIKLVTPPLVNIPVPLPQWVLMQVPMPPTSVDARENADSLSETETVSAASDDRDDTLLSMAVQQIDSFPINTNEEPSTMLAAEAAAETANPSQLADGSLSSESAFDDAHLSATFDSSTVATGGWPRAANVAGEWWSRTSPIVWLAWGWSAGTAIFVLIQIRRIINLHRLIAGGRPGAIALEVLVAQIADEMGVAPPAVRVVPLLGSPALCAWGRVSLLWPDGPLDRFSTAARRAVILHELAHLKRRDHWIGWVELLAGCGWWWNPLFWYVRHQLHENAELACDAWVVARLPDGRRAYAEALIDVAQEEPARQLSGLVLGVGDGSRSLLERRLVMIMRGGVRYQIPAVGLAAIAVVAMVTTLPRWSIADPVESRLEDAADVAVSLGVATDAAVTPILIDDANDDAPFARAADSDLHAGEVLPVAGIPRPAIASSVADDDPPRSHGLPVAEAEGALVSDHPETPAPSSRNYTFTYQADPQYPQFPPLDEGDSARLRRVEAQLATLLNEMRVLQKSREAKEAPGAKPALPAASAPSVIVGESLRSHAARQAIAPQPAQAVAAGVYESTAIETVAMIRTTYKLSEGRAEAIARTLSAQLNDDIEIKVKGDSLQITASKEDQQAIGSLIQLILRKGRPIPSRTTLTDELPTF